MENKTILLAEDDAFVSDIYNTRLTYEGFNVIVSRNGLEAIKMMEKTIPDLILLDILMPYMDGIETLKKIKENLEWKKIPIISAYQFIGKRKNRRSFEIGS